MFTVNDLKTSVGIPLGDAGRIVKAANEMLHTPSSSSSSATHPAQPKQVLDPSKATVMLSYQWDSHFVCA
jgi:hypothetical protein